MQDLWICLICGNVGCGRYSQGHASDHWKSSGHCYALETESQRVWDYASDGYVHRVIQSKADGKLVEVPTPENPEASPSRYDLSPLPHCLFLISLWLGLQDIAFHCACLLDLSLPGFCFGIMVLRARKWWVVFLHLSIVSA